MKIISLVFSLSTVNFCAYALSLPFSILLSTPNASYTTGQEILLRMTVTNTSATDIDLLVGPGRSMAEQHFEVVAIGPDGLKLNEKPTGVRAHNRNSRNLMRGSGSKFDEVIAPGKAVLQELDASRFYDFSMPGQYTLYVIRDYEADPAVHITSNKVSFLIIK